MSRPQVTRAPKPRPTTIRPITRLPTNTAQRGQSIHPPKRSPGLRRPACWAPSAPSAAAAPAAGGASSTAVADVGGAGRQEGGGGVDTRDLVGDRSWAVAATGFRVRAPNPNTTRTPSSRAGAAAALRPGQQARARSVDAGRRDASARVGALAVDTPCPARHCRGLGSDRSGAIAPTASRVVLPVRAATLNGHRPPPPAFPCGRCEAVARSPPPRPRAPGGSRRTPGAGQRSAARSPPPRRSPLW